MAKLFRTRNIVCVAIMLLLYAALQIVFFLHAFSARTITVEYLGREVFMKSLETREGSRYTIQTPPFNEEFRMHTASFRWNENHYIPPDGSTDPSDAWVGTCTLTPKSPWRQIDIFGVLGPIECHLYGDGRTDTSQ